MELLSSVFNTVAFSEFLGSNKSAEQWEILILIWLYWIHLLKSTFCLLQRGLTTSLTQPQAHFIPTDKGKANKIDQNHPVLSAYNDLWSASSKASFYKVRCENIPSLSALFRCCWRPDDAISPVFGPHLLTSPCRSGCKSHSVAFPCLSNWLQLVSAAVSVPSLFFLLLWYSPDLVMSM